MISLRPLSVLPLNWAPKILQKPSEKRRRMNAAADSSASALPGLRAQPVRLKTEVVREIALRSLTELAITLLLGAIAYPFITSALEIALLCSAIAIQTFLNACFRYYGAKSEALAAMGRSSTFSRTVASWCKSLCPTTFSYLGAYNGQILLHETGHALAASLLFQNARPQITITPFSNGVTTFSTASLSFIGQKLGSAKALFLVVASGTALALFVEGIILTIGWIAKDKFAELSAYLLNIAQGDFFAHGLYAITALIASKEDLSHDFVHLAAHGLHPAAAAITIFALPYLILRIVDAIPVPPQRHPRKSN